MLDISAAPEDLTEMISSLIKASNDFKFTLYRIHYYTVIKENELMWFPSAEMLSLIFNALYAEILYDVDMKTYCIVGMTQLTELFKSTGY